jgi:acetoin utilization deacetylase AcuC-like enzyme
MQVPVFFDSDMTRHVAGEGHPERPERILAVRDALAGSQFSSQLRWPQVTPASRESIELVHDPHYVDRIEATDGRPTTFFDADTRANAWTYRAACLAAGAAVAAVDLVVTADSATPERPFAIIRPPGHHAEPDRAMGFCFINSAAVAAAHAVRNHALERVAIVDWDVHHGNGTQRIFWSRSDVFYASLHQYPHYPGTGARSERGGGAGEGSTLNIPLGPGSGDQEYLSAFDDSLIPALEAFAPQLLVVSAGFDAHELDPLAGMNLSTATYGEMTRRLIAVADSCSDGRIVHLLEGGYDLSALASGAATVVEALLGRVNQETE